MIHNRIDNAVGHTIQSRSKMGLSRNGTGYPQYTMSLGTMMLNQRIQGIPHLMGEVCQGMKGLGMLDTLEPKVGWKKGNRNQFKKTRFTVLMLRDWADLTIIHRHFCNSGDNRHKNRGAAVVDWNTCGFPILPAPPAAEPQTQIIHCKKIANC